MAHFAEVDSDNIVLRVLVVPDEQEQRGQDFLANDLGLSGTWLQCSYNGTIRDRFPGIGYIYDPEIDSFLAPMTETNEVYIEKCNEIEAMRSLQCEEMPYSLPDGTTIGIKIKEEPPDKPRLSWVMGVAAWGQMMTADGNGSDDSKLLIAADDTIHTVTAETWKDIGDELSIWINANLQASIYHRGQIGAIYNDISLSSAEKIEEIRIYDITTGWPT